MDQQVFWRGRGEESDHYLVQPWQDNCQQCIVLRSLIKLLHPKAVMTTAGLANTKLHKLELLCYFVECDQRSHDLMVLGRLQEMHQFSREGRPPSGKVVVDHAPHHKPQLGPEAALSFY